MTAAVITMDSVLSGRLRENGHGDAKDWFATFWQHTAIPRLSAMDKHPRRGRGGASVRIWKVDGDECASLEEAVERLNVPAALCEDERAFLDMVPAEWTGLHDWLRPMKGQEFKPHSSAYGMVHMLRHKGFVETERRGEGRIPCIRRVPAAGGDL